MDGRTRLAFGTLFLILKVRVRRKICLTCQEAPWRSAFPLPMIHKECIQWSQWRCSCRCIPQIQGRCPTHDRRGLVNPKGLRYYNNLINELVSHGIQPHFTLCHDDVPQVLEDEHGGWLSQEIVYAEYFPPDFTAYADVCFKEFGDRVLHWTTVNDANIFALGGYDKGFTPPGRCSPPFGIGSCSRGNSSTEPYIAAHNMLLTHSSVFKLYKRSQLNMVLWD
ncbi:hypothetical protein K7X08_003337 [Anisodus acutangulus]|uniref:Uncharacterized protein n=1 Tax=Anisodus acutangulus TaxID=402998 RepID=A0A9Q1MGS4_9SOLA|nr:hypothetical protein K7X08_003337 [Anisodus acutangulus]